MGSPKSSLFVGIRGSSNFFLYILGIYSKLEPLLSYNFRQVVKIFRFRFSLITRTVNLLKKNLTKQFMSKYRICPDFVWVYYCSHLVRYGRRLTIWVVAEELNLDKERLKKDLDR